MKLAIEELLLPFGCSLAQYIENLGPGLLPPRTVDFRCYKEEIMSKRAVFEACEANVGRLSASTCWTNEVSAQHAMEERRMDALRRERLQLVYFFQPIDSEDLFLQMKPLLRRFQFQVEELRILEVKMLELRQKKLFSMPESVFKGGRSGKGRDAQRPGYVQRAPQHRGRFCKDQLPQ